MNHWQTTLPTVEYITTKFHPAPQCATRNYSFWRKAASGIDEYDSIMNPSIFPSTESILVTDQHFDDVADGTELVADRGHDCGYRELRFMSATRSISTSSPSPSERTSSYEYDYDEYYLHMPASQATKVDHEHLSSLDMIGHEDVIDVRELEEQGEGSDWVQ